MVGPTATPPPAPRRGGVPLGSPEIQPIIPYTHFAKASSECWDMFDNAHYYGCISLTQAVAEGGISIFKPE